MTTSRANLDLDGVDWLVAHPGPRGTTRSPKLEFQVKSSSDPIIRNDVLHHRLDVAHFNHLAGAGFQLPRYLAVVVVPPDVTAFAVCTHDSMQLGTAAYWLSLHDREQQPVGEGFPKSILVELPLRNLLTVDVLHELLGGVAHDPGSGH